jgi:hypothetical protein
MSLTAAQNEQFLERAYQVARAAVDRLLPDQRVEVLQRHIHHVDAQALIEGWQDSIDQFLAEFEKLDREWHMYHATEPQRAEHALQRARKLASDLVTAEIFPHARLHLRRSSTQQSESVELAEYRVVINTFSDDLAKLLEDVLTLKDQQSGSPS